MARAATVAVAFAAGMLVWTGSAAGATRIGPDLAGSPPPASGCGGPTCVATQLDAAVGATAPADGELVRFRLRHGPAASALGESVQLLVLDGAGTRMRVVRESPAFTVATSAADTVSTFAVHMPIAAGQRIGVKVQSTFAQPDSWLEVAGVVGGATMGQLPANHAAGTEAEYVAAADRVLLLNADLEPAGSGGGSGGSGGSGGRAGGSGGAGGGQSPAPGQPVCAAPGAATARAAAASRAAGVEQVRDLPAPPTGSLRLSPAAASAAGWRVRRVDASDSYNETAAVFDRRGRLHVAGRGGLRHRVVYVGPGGRRLVEASNDQGSVAIAAPRTGPVVAYGMDHSESHGGRLVYCDVLKLARGPAFRPVPVLAQRVGDTGFFFADVAADPRSSELHAIYELGRRAPQLYHQRLGRAAERLPLVGGTLRHARLAVRGDTVAVVARTDGALNLLVRHRTGRWQRTVLARRAGVFDLAVAADGRARVAFADAVGRLRLFTGRRVVATGVPVASVGLAVDGGGGLHVALTPTARACHTTNVWECRRGGIHHLRIDPAGRRGTASTVQPTTGDAPGDLAIAVHGRTIAIAYGDPARGRALTVARRG